MIVLNTMNGASFQFSGEYMGIWSNHFDFDMIKEGFYRSLDIPCNLLKDVL